MYIYVYTYNCIYTRIHISRHTHAHVNPAPKHSTPGMGRQHKTRAATGMQHPPTPDMNASDGT